MVTLGEMFGGARRVGQAKIAETGKGGVNRDPLAAEKSKKALIKAEVLTNILDEMPKSLDMTLMGHSINIMDELNHTGPGKDIAFKLAMRYVAKKLPGRVEEIYEIHAFNCDYCKVLIKDSGNLDKLLKVVLEHKPEPVKEPSIRERAVLKLKLFKDVAEYFRFVKMDENQVREACYLAQQKNYRWVGRKLLDELVIAYCNERLTPDATEDFEHFYSACKGAHIKVSDRLIGSIKKPTEFTGYGRLDTRGQKEAWSMYSVLNEWGTRDFKMTPEMAGHAFQAAENAKHRAVGKWLLGRLYNLYKTGCMDPDAAKAFQDKMSMCNDCASAANYKNN